MHAEIVGIRQKQRDDEPGDSDDGRRQQDEHGFLPASLVDPGSERNPQHCFAEVGGSEEESVEDTSES